MRSPPISDHITELKKETIAKVVKKEDEDSIEQEDLVFHDFDYIGY